MENFDLMAKDYDTDKRADRAMVIADEIRRHIGAGKGTAIEFGCGTGLVGLQLANDFAELTLLDSSVEMVRQATTKLEALSHPAVSALCYDLLEDVPERMAADYIFSSLVLHHIKDTTDIFRRFHRILNDGGRLLIVDLDEEDGGFHAKYPDFEGHNGFNHRALADIAEAAGFREVTIKTFYRDRKVFMGKESPYSLFILDAVK